MVTIALARTDTANSILPMRMSHGSASPAHGGPSPPSGGRGCTSLTRLLPTLVHRPQEDPVRPSGPPQYSPCLVVSQVRQDLGHHEVPLGPRQPGRTEKVGRQPGQGPRVGGDQVPHLVQPPA